MAPVSGSIQMAAGGVGARSLRCFSITQRSVQIPVGPAPIIRTVSSSVIPLEHMLPKVTRTIASVGSKIWGFAFSVNANLLLSVNNTKWKKFYIWGVKRIIVILLFCLSFLACDKHELCDVVSQQAVSVMETGYVSAPQTNYIFGVESSNILSVRTTPECQRTFRTFRNNDCLFRNGKCINPRIFDFSIGEMISGWTGKLSLDRFIYSICFLRL